MHTNKNNVSEFSMKLSEIGNQRGGVTSYCSPMT